MCDYQFLLPEMIKNQYFQAYSKVHFKITRVEKIYMNMINILMYSFIQGQYYFILFMDLKTTIIFEVSVAEKKCSLRHLKQ